ncbi:MAG TPA: RHS repeat-associated core domain-containing protein [Chitinophagaceae bacterium]|nr:RHS repeat-associated core domain-containing protein [Chitinophagaceae bacterium]
MDQKGWIVSGSDFVDRLRYTYASNNNSNKLLNVNDISTTPSIKLGDFRTSPLHPQAGAKTTATVDYTYDDNGNLKKDLNKDIGSSSTDGIVYNYLNLPEQITMRNASGGTKGTIVYTYSAASAKLQKQVTDYSESGRTITTTTQYIGAAVLESRVISPADAARPNYTNKVLFLGHEEGRIRFEEATTSTCPAQPARIFYDYFLKDHLGNVRMVLTEQSETKCYGAATVEDATWVSENKLYNIVDGRRVAKNVEPGASGIASFGAKFYRTNGNNSNERTGLGIVLKVMKGDQVKITAESFYSIPGGNAGVPINMAATELLNALLGAKGFPVGKGLSSTDLTALNTPTSLQSFLNTNSGNTSLAKAAVNYALFDEQMRFVGGDYDPVPSGGGYKNHQKFFNSPVNITRSGYLYIYVSNESNLNVFFDNLNVSHTNGPILEETHYYPFGLTMAGISSRALNGVAESKIKYNEMELQSKEFSDGSGLEMYEYKYRFYYHQIGRFISQDRLADKYPHYAPYQFAGNEVPNAIDLDGLEPLRINKETKNLVIVVQGFGGNPPNGATQASNAAKTDPGLAPDEALGSIMSTGPSLQVGVFASSSSDNTKNDVLSTIKDFRSTSPDGNLILIGHSGGADNIIELAKENTDVKINLLITLDARDPKALGWTDTNIPSNVENAINYYQNTDKLNLVSDRKMDFSSKTNGANILSPGSNHRSIDNDQLKNVIKDINNQLMNRNPVDAAKNRSQPVNDPKKSNSDPISN